MMKVLMINSVCGIRSTGRICTDLAEVLEKEGHTCKIVYGRESVPEKYRKYAVRIGSDLGVKMHAGLSRIFDDAGFHSRFATHKFIRWVKAYDPDVIHLHNIHGYYLNIEILFDYLRTCGKKIIWTLHDCWAFTGHCPHFTYIGCEKWKTQCGHYKKKRGYPKSIFLDRSQQNFERKKKLFTGIPNLTLVTPSKWLAGLVKESFLKEYPVEVIHNGIDLTVFKPTPSDFRQRYHLEDKKVILGVASVWDRRKGFDDFLDLAKHLDDSYRIVLVGVSEEQQKILPKNIIGIGRTNSTKELAEIYTVADVFLNLSVEETMGLVTVEAMACGASCIVLNKTAVPEFVNEKCGIVLSNYNYRDVLLSFKKTDLIEDSPCIEQASNYERGKQYNFYLNIYGI